MIICLFTGIIFVVVFLSKAPTENVDTGLKLEQNQSLEEASGEGSRPEYALIDALLELNRSEVCIHLATILSKLFICFKKL